MFIVVCISCEACNSQAVSLFANEPTDEEVDNVADSIGAMFCIRKNVYEVSENEIVTDKIYHD